MARIKTPVIGNTITKISPVGSEDAFIIEVEAVVVIMGIVVVFVDVMGLLFRLTHCEPPDPNSI